MSKVGSEPRYSQIGTPDCLERHFRTVDPRAVPEIPSGATFAEKERAMKWRAGLNVDPADRGRQRGQYHPNNIDSRLNDYINPVVGANSRIPMKVPSGVNYSSQSPIKITPNPMQL